MQNPQSASNGVAELWVDNVQYMNATNLKFVYDGVGWTEVGLTGNTQGMVGIPCTGTCNSSNSINGYRPIMQDIDDFTMRTTGRIGCLSGVSSLNPPNNLQVK
jgi:hypothetical protein